MSPLDVLAETPENIERVAGFFDRYIGGAWPDSCGPAIALLRELRRLRDSAPSWGRASLVGDAPPCPATLTPAGEGPEAGAIPTPKP